MGTPDTILTQKNQMSQRQSEFLIAFKSHNQNATNQTGSLSKKPSGLGSSAILVSKKDNDKHFSAMLNFDVDGRNFQSDLAINKKKKKPQTNVFLPPSLLTDVTAE